MELESEMELEIGIEFFWKLEMLSKLGVMELGIVDIGYYKNSKFWIIQQLGIVAIRNCRNWVF